MTELKIGDTIPKFSTTDENGNIVTDEVLRGKKTIIFFYPKDNTPGCTAEACSLRDHYGTFDDKGYVIYGVSADTEKKHQNFIKKYSFPFSLLADTEKEMIKAFDIWKPKKFMGREFLGILRTTFVISEDGKIEKIIKKVKTKSHAEQILEVIGEA